MFATEDKIIHLVSFDVAKDYLKGWESLGLSTTSFTSDDKKLALIAGWGAPNDVALATEWKPQAPAASAKKKEATHA